MWTLKDRLVGYMGSNECTAKGAKLPGSNIRFIEKYLVAFVVKIFLFVSPLLDHPAINDYC